MTGTRHERVGIAIAAYIIGFTTAFIAFGVNKMHHESHIPRHSDQNYKPALEAKVVSAETFKKVHKSIDAINYDDEGLSASVGGYNRIISAKLSEQAASAASADTEAPGFHYDIHGALVSTDKWFAFFCEQKQQTDTDCVPYIYSLYDDSVHSVRVNGEKTQIKIADLSVVWNEQNQLSLQGLVSDDTKKPWMFIKSETALSENKDDVTKNETADIQVQ
jgi:hypothetical protein